MSFSGSLVSSGLARGRFRHVSRQLSFFEDSEDEESCRDDSGEDFDHESPIKKILTVLNNMQRSVLRHLLTFQVVLFVISLILSGMVFMPLSLVFQGFKGQCLLFSDISLIWNSNKTVTIDLETTRFGSVRQCDVTTFIAVSVFVVCIIFSWFYLCSIFSASGSDENKQSTNKVQIPALLIFLGLFISTIVAAAKISAGFGVWCRNIVDNMPAGPDRKLACSDFERLNWTNNINNYMFYTRFRIAEVACWLLCTSLFVLCCVTCVGCYHMLIDAHKITVSQATLSVSLEESEDGSLVVVSAKHKHQKGEFEGSSHDYFTPMQDQMLSSDEAELRQNRHKEVLLSTEATVHLENTPDDSDLYTERKDIATVNDAFLSDISDHEEMPESGTVASGKINTSDGDEVPSLMTSHSISVHSKSEDDQSKSNEKEALSKNVTANGGYGAVSSHR
ncbi:hypothetical protein EGW08_020376 [Elysia chlorotica]|uniref:Transmembrane protein n=1 Tax=Elysia chlorotica TaxID=188477 RepID=A0A433SRL6_ELYCH|nr:hypothetical protein EGW08_020376 [Elysia chlorotica]